MSVYRAMIDAACRVGSTHYAILAREMRKDNLRPDSLFSCLLSAFAMDGNLGNAAVTSGLVKAALQ